MPQVAAAAAAAITNAIVAISTTVATITGSAAAGTAVATALASLSGGFGITAFVTAWGTVAALSSLFMGKPRIGGVGQQVDFKADPQAGIPYVMGETGVGGNIVHANTAEAKNAHLLYLTVLSLGPITDLVEFRANATPVTFSASNAVGTPYHNMMWHVWQPGEVTPATFDPPATTMGLFTEWSADHKLTGLAASWLVLEYDKYSKVYPSGTPKPLWVIKGVKAYDPRQDSTYPGGSGSQRIDDESTWAYTENPFLHALTWVIGRRQNGKLVMGVGAPVEMIDIAAFVEGANVCDANAWKLGGQAASTDDKWQVLTAILQAGGGWPLRLGAKISCGVQTPLISLATLTAGDVVGEVSVTATQPRRQRINGVIPRYRSPAHDYQIVAADRVSVSTYVTEDGGERTREMEWPLVQDVDQAAQLATYAIEDAREFGPIVIPCKPKWLGFRPGDAITVDEPEWGLNGQLCRILKRDFDPATAVVTLALRSETTAKHDFALGKTGVAPPTPGLTGIDPLYIDPPGADAFDVTGVVWTPKRAALVVTGAADTPYARDVLIRYRIEGETNWKYWPPIDAGQQAIIAEITGLEIGARYEVETAYRSNLGVISDWTGEGTVTAGGLDLYAFLQSIPSKNLWRKQDWVPAGSAALVDPMALGDAKWGFTLPGNSPSSELSVLPKTQGLTTDGSWYAFSFVAKVDSGTAVLRAGWRTPLGATIPDVPDQVFNLTTTKQRFVWNEIGSTDPDFTSAIFHVYQVAGEIPAGRTVSFTDPMIEYGRFATTGWRPSPDDTDLLRYAGYLGDLAATKNVIQMGTSFTGTPSVNDIWVDTTDATQYTVKTWNGSAWVAASTVGGAFGTNLYRTPGGSIATLSDFLTSLGIAAGFTGQGPWATYGSKNPNYVLQYLDGTTGRLTSVFGNPANVAAGAGWIMSAWPFTSDSSSISVSAFTLTGYGQTFTFPSATMTGLESGKSFKVFVRWDVGSPYYTAVKPEYVAAYQASDNWLLLGEVLTKTGGGAYVLPTPPAEAGGVGGFGGLGGDQFGYAQP